ncbi:MAG: GerMN domain-containing protein [Deltaproteobacteria bacterium]|nr:MAG: GerMN domain-containing protein [Deltaproteobacteria bacterium]
MSAAKRRKHKAIVKKNGKKILLISLGILIVLTATIGIVFYYKPFKTLLPLGKKSVSQTTRPLTGKTEKEIIVFFSDYTRDKLSPERIEINPSNDLIGLSKQVINELIKGPKSNLGPTIPRGTEMRDLHIDQTGTVYVDFTRELAANHPGGSSAELHTIYSIVNSLLMNFPEIKRVQILIEGEKIKQTLAGHIDARRPFNVNREIIGNLNLPRK